MILYHHLYTSLELLLRLPPQFAFAFDGSPKSLNFCGPEVTWVNPNNFLPNDTLGAKSPDIPLTTPISSTQNHENQSSLQERSGPSYEFSHRVLFTSCNNIITWFILLQHHPLHANIIFCVPPIAQGINVSHVQATL